MAVRQQGSIRSGSPWSCDPEQGRSAVGSDGITHNGPRRRPACAGISLVLAGIVVTFLIYLLWDEPVRQWLLAHPNTWHEHHWVNAFRQLGKAYVPVWLVLLWGCLTNRWRTTAVTLLALLFVGLSVCPLKVLASRRRPNDPALRAGYAALDSHHPWARRVSFPSGDTAGAFAVATVLALLIRRPWAVLFLGAAGAIGLLRITALVHYPSDVFAGMMIGVLAGWWSVRWALHQLPEREFTMRGRWRILLGVLLVVLVPLLSAPAGMKPLLVFLRFYGAAAVGLLLIGTLVHRNAQHQAGPSCPPETDLAQAPIDR